MTKEIRFSEQSWSHEEREVRLSSADIEQLIAAGVRHAEGLTAQLAKSDWTPRRSHIEQARNSIVKLAEILTAMQSRDPAQSPSKTSPPEMNAPQQAERLPKSDPAVSGGDTRFDLVRENTRLKIRVARLEQELKSAAHRVSASHNSGERDPSVMPGSDGAADTRCSADSENAPYYHAWLEMIDHCNKLKEENYRLRNALPQAPRDQGSRLTFCETCNASTMHRPAATVNGVQTFECQRCALSRPHQRGGQ